MRKKRHHCLVPFAFGSVYSPPGLPRAASALRPQMTATAFVGGSVFAAPLSASASRAVRGIPVCPGAGQGNDGANAPISVESGMSDHRGFARP